MKTLKKIAPINQTLSRLFCLFGVIRSFTSIHQRNVNFWLIHSPEVPSFIQAVNSDKADFVRHFNNSEGFRFRRRDFHWNTVTFAKKEGGSNVFHFCILIISLIHARLDAKSIHEFGRENIFCFHCFTSTGWLEL